MKKQLVHCTLAVLLGLGLVALLLRLGAMTPVQAQPGARYVAPPPTGSDVGNDCTTSGNPCATIQHAIDGADSGDEILVADGTYAPGGTVAAVNKALTIRGAYDPATFDGPDPDLYQTVLDAGRGGSVISITSAGSVALLNLTLTQGDGSGNCGTEGCGGGIYSKDTDLYVGQCVITDNVGSSTDTGSGGGIYVDNSAGSQPTVVLESQIVSNTASTEPSSEGDGGGLYVAFGTATLRENEILDNLGHASNQGFGGGVYLRSLTQADVLTNVIQGNKANLSNFRAGWGGGIYIGSSSAVYAAGNHIESNRNSAGGGGGIYSDWSDVHMTRNRIVDNTAVGGGGLYVRSLTPVTLTNNLIARNTASFRGGGVYVAHSFLPPSQALLVNNTIVDNGRSGVEGWKNVVITLTNNLIAQHDMGVTVTVPASATISADTNLVWNTFDPIVGTNPIQQDPLLTPDYRLSDGSPALDTGLDVPWLTVDLEGNPRSPGAYDIGAYERVPRKVYLPLVLNNLE